jgi:alpha-tubulin suppressor-like RCC1 family protein
MLLLEDGTIWAWGGNIYGELGNGTKGTIEEKPTLVVSLMDVSVVDASFHSIAAREDGTVWTWGLNRHGQLGDGTAEDRFTASEVSGLGNITEVSAGLEHSIALTEDGGVWAWGWNEFGQLGDGTTEDKLTPVQITSLSDIKAISGGRAHNLALREDGSVWGWGYNFYGQLGQGFTSDYIGTPVRIQSLNNILAITAGGDFSLALLKDGTVWAWGRNQSGQLGNGTFGHDVNQTHPVQVVGLTDVRAIAAGSAYGIALRQDGTVWTWGNNSRGQLGIGTTESEKAVPSQVPNLIDIVSIAAGSSHTLALSADGTLWVWGNNDALQLGSRLGDHQSIPGPIIWQDW